MSDSPQVLAQQWQQAEHLPQAQEHDPDTVTCSGCGWQGQDFTAHERQALSEFLRFAMAQAWSRGAADTMRRARLTDTGYLQSPPNPYWQS